jgi:acyl-CoA thioesterase 8
MLQESLKEEGLSPKYREYLKLRIKESSPVDFREVEVPDNTFEQVR